MLSQRMCMLSCVFFNRSLQCWGFVSDTQIIPTQSTTHLQMKCEILPLYDEVKCKLCTRNEIPHSLSLKWMKCSEQCYCSQPREFMFLAMQTPCTSVFDFFYIFIYYFGGDVRRERRYPGVLMPEYCSINSAKIYKKNAHEIAYNLLYVL